MGLREEKLLSRRLGTMNYFSKVYEERAYNEANCKGEGRVAVCGRGRKI